jgi:putative DNA primase/helicase
MRLALPKTTASRTIIIRLVPRLPDEKIEDFNHADDDTFITLRRKLMRWAVDNAQALKDARPIMPTGFANRLRMNWHLPLAIADLAGDKFAKDARAAAVKLSRQRQDPSEGKRLLAAFQAIFATRHEITSDEVMKRVNADPTGEWSEFRNGGPITQRQIAALLSHYEIFPVVLHPTKRSDVSRRGYRREQFTEVLARYLPSNDPNIRTPKRKPTRK